MKTSKELWAVVDENDDVLFASAGKNTKPRLMTYHAEKHALIGLNWAKRRNDVNPELLDVKLLYKSSGA